MSNRRATQPYVANFEEKCRDGRTYWTSKPVIAWDDEGRALISNGRGQLVPAIGYDSFRHVEEDASGYVAAIPGGGWQLAWKQDDGTEFLDPVVAWVINRDGWARAVSVDSNGDSEIVERHGDDGPRFIPPEAAA